MRKLHFKREYWIDIGLILLLLALFTPVFYTHIYSKDNNDYVPHTRWARQMVEEPEKVPGYITAHSGWQILVIGVHALIRRSWKATAMLVTLATAVLAGWLLFRIFRRETLKRKIPPLWAAGIALALVTAAPVSLVGFWDRQLYFGYVGISTYHNPTILLLKPVAILQFLYAVKVFSGRQASWRDVIFALLLSVFSAFAKPNYTICLAPALGLLALVTWWKKKFVEWKLLILGICLPSAMIVLWQMILSYTGSTEGQVIFFPFGLMRNFSDYLLPKFILSILFPLLLAIFKFKDIRKDPKMILAWLGFFLGAFYTYFLAESGFRFQDGNFGWSGEIANFILFTASTLFAVERSPFIPGLSLPTEKLDDTEHVILPPPDSPASSRWQWKILWAAWGLHILFGVIYFLVCLFTNSYQ